MLCASATKICATAVRIPPTCLRPTGTSRISTNTSKSVIRWKSRHAINGAVNTRKSGSKFQIQSTRFTMRLRPQLGARRPYHSYVAAVPHELSSKLKIEREKVGFDAAPFFLRNAAEGYITLTSHERRLFDMLKLVAGRYSQKMELRVAGGWVRDKLLGTESGDIDISVDIMSGEALCRLLEQYLETLSVSELQEISSDASSSVSFSVAGSPAGSSSILGVKSDFKLSPSTSSSTLPPIEKPSVSITKLNPEQSKHLETAIIRLYGVELNFAQLRTDTYDTESRIPRIRVAAPAEDAFRRDFTINALFYNIMTDTIEDFTGCGIDSLLNQTINTPLPPLDTLKDDPLRALRAIRFAARFGFSIHPELKSCIADPLVHQLLLTKVTPPRIGVEIQKMFAPSAPPSTASVPPVSDQNVGLVESGPRNNPLQALEHLVVANLHVPVFQCVTSEHYDRFAHWTPEVSRRSLLLCTYLHHIFAIVDQHRADVTQHISTHYRSALMTMTFLVPLVGESYSGLHKKAAKGHIPWVESFKSSLQYPLQQVFSVAHALAESSSLPSIIDNLVASSGIEAPEPSNTCSAKNDSSDSNQLQNLYTDIFLKALENEQQRETLGLWLRRTPAFWRSLVLLSKLFRTDSSSLEMVSTIPSDASTNWLLSEFPRELALIDAIEKIGLDASRHVEPAYDGRELCAHLGIRQGPKVGEALHAQLAYQVVHLDASREQVLSALKAKFLGQSSRSL